ncbi:MAG: hypothetical protein J7L53_02460 [Deltaproteobacteria bacterium]|nr:hypothetical protein [Deltaproteobacteria bacterium]
MDEEKDILAESEKEYRELNNELVVPAYRRFCEELNLPFHFWDELPKDSFDPEISHGEFELHKEAMDLFNKLKPELVFFKNKIVRFQFTSWDGSFSYDAWPIQDFIEKVSDELFYLQNLENRFKIVSSISAFGSFLLVFIATVFLIGKYSPWDFLSQASIWLGIGLGGIVYYLLTRRINKIPRRIIDDGRLEGVTDRIKSIREQLAKIRGSQPDPLRQKRIGNLILEELQQSMSPTEIEKLVHRLKIRLFVVSNENDK